MHPLYLSVQPNAGLPVLHDGHTHFPLSGTKELAKAHVDFCQKPSVSASPAAQRGTTPRPHQTRRGCI